MPEQPTAAIEVRVYASDIDGAGDPLDEWTEDADFKREIEKKIAAFVADLLYLSARNVDAEAEWYLSTWPCRQAVSQLQRDGGWTDVKCGEKTRRQHEPYGRDRGVYRVCLDGHKMPVDQIARREASHA